MVSMATSKVSFVIGSNHPQMGKDNYPYSLTNYSEALSLHHKIQDEGYRSELKMIQSLITETVIITQIE